MFALRIALTLCCFVRSDGLRNVPMYASDLSEHCLRRDALPSVFLARRAMTATSQVLYFSKLDRPYSCYASVRTEASHSIVMVLQLDWSEREKDCKEGHQLTVYEFPETFGAYWGPIPEAVLELNPDKPVYTKQYTLFTDPLPTKATTEYTTMSTIITNAPTTTSITEETQGFLEIEVPLVNISVSLVSTDNKKDDLFDIFKNVPPSSEEYIIPLGQKAVEKQDGRRKGGLMDDKDRESLFQMEYQVGPFTPDHRLKVHEWPKKNNTNRNRTRWKKKKLQDKRIESRINNAHTREPSKTRKFFRKQYTLPPSFGQQSSYKHVLPQPITERKYEDTTVEFQDVFNVIDDVMKHLNESGDLQKQEQSTHSDLLGILNMSKNTDHNMSVYLAPYPTYTFLPVSDVSINFTNNEFDVPLRGISKSILSISSQGDEVNDTLNKSELEYSSNKYSPQYSSGSLENIFAKKLKQNIITSTMENENKNTLFDVQPETRATTSITSRKTEETGNTLTINYKTQEEHIRTDQQDNDILFPVSTTDKGSLSGTLVDHESWENVVQSAQVMAGLLSQHGSELENSSRFNTSDMPGTQEQNKRRILSKRSIAAIGIDNAQPRRRVSTFKLITQPMLYGPGDVVEFAHLLELPDDEMSNRVAINLDTNSSTKLFDMCDSANETKTRLLMAFNSSRILISIGNFTIPHAMVVLTAGFPLYPDRVECPKPTVECQVQGARICIDATNACDGIPNCGSLSAYDEDRVLCGFIQQDRNVFLAAATLLMMVTTALYIVYYWLTRCVPNVADAFFVYYDSADNELFLDSIMRSPLTDVGTGTNFRYESAFFEGREFFSYSRKKSGNILKRMLSHLPNLRLLKQKRLSSDTLPEEDIRQSLSRFPRKKTYSFAESEIRNFMHNEKVDRQVQTGPSLEMAYLKTMNSLKKNSSDIQLLGTTKRQSARAPILEPLHGDRRLGSLDTISDEPGPSERSEISNYARIEKPIIEEEEIGNIFYDPDTVKKGVPKPTGTTDVNQGRKSLRFDEHTTYIPRHDEDEEHSEVQAAGALRHSKIHGGRTAKSSHKKSDENPPERGADFRRFFKKKKGPK